LDCSDQNVNEGEREKNDYHCGTRFC